MVITHNLSSMNIARQFKLTTKIKQTAAERLSSGFRINRAADDAAGLAISEKMRSQIRGLNQGARNVQDGISFCHVADGALNEVHAVLGRIRELAVQASSDTYVEEDRAAIEAEFVQLKEEINRISRTTEFNTKRIFDDGIFKIEFSDDICPIKIFNANHNNPDDPDTYGGIILLDDTRIPWSAIDPNMVTLAPDTGETVFRAGEYQYNVPSFGFYITCEDGSKPPEIKVEFEVSATGDGIWIAGGRIPWEDVVNDDEESILEHLGEEGHYHFRGREGTGSFSVEAGAMLSDIIKALNEYNGRTHTRYYSVYNGYYATQAVDVVDAGSTVRITQDLYDHFIRPNTGADLGIRLRADSNAIWVVDRNGNEIADSRKTWAALGLENWNSGDDISDQKKYTYTYQAADGSLAIAFDFFLLDETSKDSVIDGINNMTLKDWDRYGSTETRFTLGPAGNILSGKLTAQNHALSLVEQGEFERNFDSKTDIFAAADLFYDNTANTVSAVLHSNNGAAKTMTYEAVSLTSSDTVQKKAALAVQYLTAKEVQAAMSASGPYDTLTDVVGTSRITSTGYLSETYTVTADAITTDKLDIGETYAAASIDFSGLGTDYQLYDLLGTGFDSTCMTCDNHYSVLFVYGGTEHTTANGYGFTTTQDGKNYTLQIDLKTMLEKGISDTTSFTAALLEVLDAPAADFDFHFTQYAADANGTLYLCDNRPPYAGTASAQKASFYAEPYNINVIDIAMTLQHTADSRSVSLSYDYDIGSLLAGEINASMEEDTAGLYVKNAAGKWELYNSDNYYDENGSLLPGISSAPIRYRLQVNNTIDGEQTYDTLMQEIAAQPGFSVNAADYAYLRCTTDENPNDAYVSAFRFQKENARADGMWIQAGANQFQGLFLKWDGFSSHTLGLSYLSMTNRDDAGKLITRTDHAIEKVSRIRSAFGAYSNRLERIYSMNGNYAENLQAAVSVLRDADMAEEFLSCSKANILSQTIQAILAQANRHPAEILSLLQ